MLNAIILAGMQTIKDSKDGVNKALFRINGRTMIEYVVDAVRNAEDIDRIIVVGQKEELEALLKGKIEAVISSSGTIMENVMSGVKFLGFDRNILICTSDIPLITPEAINDFTSRAKATGADFCYPIVERKVNDERFPEIDRTYVKTKDGSFTGGNVFYVNPRVVGNSLQITDKLLKFRKNPLKMAHILSLSFLVRLLTGTLTIQAAEKKFSKIMQIKAKAVISGYPEIGNDVDKTSDIIVATAHLSQ